MAGLVGVPIIPLMPYLQGLDIKPSELVQTLGVVLCATSLMTPEILEALGELTHPNIREAVEPFLEDVNDQAKFNAVVAVLAQSDAKSIPALLALLLDEESVRIRTKIATGMSEKGWEVPDDQRDAVRKALPPEFNIDGMGFIKKR